MAEDHHHFMGLTLEESRLALEAGNSPVGSIIVRDGEIIGRGQNRVISHNDPTCTARPTPSGTRAAHWARPTCPAPRSTRRWSPARCAAGRSSWRRSKRLVLGARHAEMGRTDYGDYSVEKLLEMGNQTVELVTGVRVAECEALRRSWSGWVEPEA